MDMTETSKLRDLLDVRGVEYKAGDVRAMRTTRWVDATGRQVLFAEHDTGETRFVMDCIEFTPEQAVAATLGPEPSAKLCDKCKKHMYVELHEAGGCA